jgi:hypothetical protein
MVTQAKKVQSQNPPHFVGAAIIMTQQIVCQEKKYHFRNFFQNFLKSIETRF